MGISGSRDPDDQAGGEMKLHVVYGWTWSFGIILRLGYRELRILLFDRAYVFDWKKVLP